MTTDARRNTNREVRLALACVSLTLALALLGGNIRQGLHDVGMWAGWQQVAFFLCLVDAALVGWSPVRDFRRGDWRPFADSRLRGWDDEK